MVTPGRWEAQVEKACRFCEVEVIFRIADRMNTYCDVRHHVGGASENEYHDFNVVCVSAGQDSSWGSIAEKVIDYIRATEIQSAHAKHIDKGVHKVTQIRSKD